MQVFDLLGIDFIGPFKVSFSRSKFIINMINFFFTIYDSNSYREQKDK